MLLLLMLLKHGGDVNATDGRLQTALHWAAVQDSVAVADVLVQNGARVEAVDENGYRVLFSYHFYCFPFRVGKCVDDQFVKG